MIPRGSSSQGREIAGGRNGGAESREEGGGGMENELP